MNFTVLGSSGFIGRRLLDYLSAAGHHVNTLDARRLPHDEVAERVEGHVIYSIGMTGNFRENPSATLKAHVGILQTILESGRFESLTYISSTRVYLGARSAKEDADLRVNPANKDDIYNLSKLMGEALCRDSFRRGRRVHVARVSNVLGNNVSENGFLNGLWIQAKSSGKLCFTASALAEKDYICIEDVLLALYKISSMGTADTYNVASGVAISNKQIADIISDHRLCTVVFGKTQAHGFPIIDISRIQSECDFHPGDPIRRLKSLIAREN